MNRYEEIHNAALECSRDTEICHQWSFIKGAEWSDEHPQKGLVNIDKACDAYCRLCDTKECGDTGECVWVEKFRKRLMK